VRGADARELRAQPALIADQDDLDRRFPGSSHGAGHFGHGRMVAAHGVDGNDARPGSSRPCPSGIAPGISPGGLSTALDIAW
jgi:hypothetical protein